MAKRNAFGSFLLYLCGVLVIGGTALGGWRMWSDKATTLTAARQALAEEVARGPIVQVATVSQGPKERLIRLLGDTRPLQAATLYSKVSGYVTEINVDRGVKVKAGDLLATVASVETDQQYEAAVRDLQDEAQLGSREGSGGAWLDLAASSRPGGHRLHHGDRECGAGRDDEVL